MAKKNLKIRQEPNRNAYAKDYNSILCLSCGCGAEQNPIFSSKDFVRAEGERGKEKIKENSKFRDSERMKCAKPFLYEL